MKKVMLLGDSIRMGYDAYVRIAFDGIAHIYYPEENGRFAAYTLRNLTDWERLLDEKRQIGRGVEVDLIHWNVGLWDCLTQLDGEPLTDIATYQHYLGRIHKVMSKLYPNARQIFATSTAVIDKWFEGERFTRCNATVEKYNQAAVKVLAPLGVSFNDLYTLTREFPDSFHSDGTHFNTKSGQSALVKQVVETLEKALGVKAKELDFDKLFTKETGIVGI